MTALVSNHAEGQMREDWFVEAKQEVDDLLSKLAELDEASLTPEEREYRAFSKPKVDEAKSRFEEDQSVNRHQFVQWIVDTYVPEAKRQPLPESATKSDKKSKRNFQSWCTKNITKHLHVDNIREESN